MSVHSYSSFDDVTHSFQIMFCGSVIANTFKLARTEGTYLTNHGIALCFISILMSEVKSSDTFLLSFDESLGSVTGTCERELIVQYWSRNESDMKACYLEFTFLHQGGHQNLFKHFDDVTADPDRERLNVYGRSDYK